MDIPVHVHVYGWVPTRCSLPVPGAVHMRSACAVRIQCVSHREVCKAAPLLPVGSSADICDGGGCAYAHLFV